jgi:indole-3-glycerol phosphate synthase
MFLEDIVSHTLAELEVRKGQLTLTELKQMAESRPPPLDLALALRGNNVRLIAEVKKASPSRGIIRHDFNPVAIAQTYAENGASAISVLTEPKYFQGSLDYLREIKQALVNRLPVLRKDFILDPYQVYESRADGADSLLLIVATLKPRKLDELLRLSHKLGMSCLVEVHNETELEIALASSARIIGINNRDLKTLEIDLNITERLKSLIPEDRIVVSESGIRSRDDIEKLRKLGVDAVLVGEALMSAPDIAARMKELLPPERERLRGALPLSSNTPPSLIKGLAPKGLPVPKVRWLFQKSKIDRVILQIALLLKRDSFYIHLLPLGLILQLCVLI